MYLYHVIINSHTVVLHHTATHQNSTFVFHSEVNETLHMRIRKRKIRRMDIQTIIINNHFDLKMF